MPRNLIHPFTALVHPTRIRILQYMMGKGYLTVKEIAETLNLDVNDTRIHLLVLYRFGFLDRTVDYGVKPLYRFAIKYEPLIKLLREKIPELSMLLSDLEFHAKREQTKVATATP